MEVCYEKTYSKKISFSLNNFCRQKKSVCSINDQIVPQIQDVAIQKVLERNPNVKMKIQVKVVKIIAGVWLIYYYQSLFRNKTFMFHEMTQRFKIINVFGIWKRMGYFHFVLLEYVNRNKAFYFGEKVAWKNINKIPHDFSYSLIVWQIPLISEECENILAVARGISVWFENLPPPYHYSTFKICHPLGCRMIRRQ